MKIIVIVLLISVIYACGGSSGSSSTPSGGASSSSSGQQPTAKVMYRVKEAYYDNDNDGEADSVASYVYNDLGQVVVYVHLIANPNEESYAINYTYENLRIKTEAWDYGIDGNVDYLYSNTYSNQGEDLLTEQQIITYDEEGNITQTTNWWIVDKYSTDGRIEAEESSIDSPDNLAVAVHYSYDINNRIDVKEHYDSNAIADGLVFPSRVNRYFYDAVGQLERSEYDGNNDGTLEHVSYYYFDSNGVIETIERDRFGDGTVDSVIQFVTENGICEDSIERQKFGYNLSVKCFGG